MRKSFFWPVDHLRVKVFAWVRLASAAPCFFHLLYWTVALSIEYQVVHLHLLSPVAIYLTKLTPGPRGVYTM